MAQQEATDCNCLEAQVGGGGPQLPMYMPNRVGLRGQSCFRHGVWKQGDTPAGVRTVMGTSSCTMASHGRPHSCSIHESLLLPSQPQPRSRQWTSNAWVGEGCHAD